ncbi:hypothetical protein EMMF5_001540 [Cystobasidiomycetes sp. EMM_F5]
MQHSTASTNAGTSAIAAQAKQRTTRSNAQQAALKSQQESLASLVKLYHHLSSFPPLALSKSEKAASQPERPDAFANMDDYVTARLISRKKPRVKLEASFASSTDLSDNPESIAEPFNDPVEKIFDPRNRGSSTKPQQKWKPFSPTFTSASVTRSEAQERGRRIIDALHGTSEARHLGVQLARDIWRSHELWRVDTPAQPAQKPAEKARS